jgi:hypothetical protein
MHMMSRVTISLLAVDEAHCISQVRAFLTLSDALTFLILGAYSGVLASDRNI